jgi:hypothetical protein
MTMCIKRFKLIGLLLAIVWFQSAFPSTAVSLTADHRVVIAFNQIPADDFASIRTSFFIYYGHTSHGSQIMSGLSMLENENIGLYRRPSIYEPGTDLGNSGWDQRTRAYLNAHPGTNLVMWSWCGQLSWYSESAVNDYLGKMNYLETQYPNVIFVYMTGHLDGSGTSGTLYRNNNRIRSFCAANNKVLFDFADIESYDPGGNYYPDGSDQCEWCATWCDAHDCPDCNYCAHSHCFNCYQKGKAFWWMLAHLNGTSTSGEGSDDSGGSCFIRTIAY